MLSRVSLVQLRRHLARVRACDACPDMVGPVVVGPPVISPVMLIGQAPGPHEGAIGRPFAWTAGKTLFGWFESIGLSEEQFRRNVFMAAVCRCFPGKSKGAGKGSGGDRVPSADEIERCRPHLEAELALIRPRLVIPVGKLAIAQFHPEVEKLTEVIGARRRHAAFDTIALPHPSGASSWHRTEPGKTLLGKALQLIERHEAWRALAYAPRP
jgi:uracil-DNA glycosylase